MEKLKTKILKSKSAQKLKAKLPIIKGTKHILALRENLAKKLSKFRIFMSAPDAESAGYIHKIEDELLNQISKPVRSGFIAIFVALGFFVIWGSSAPLDKASVAPGTLVLSGKTKQIQHLEGGIIESVLVADGDVVEEGQELIKLKTTQAQSNLRKVYYQFIASKVQEARLVAEQIRSSKIMLDDKLAMSDDFEIKKIIDTQTAQLKNRQDALISRDEIYAQKKLQYEEQINGLEAQKSSVIEQRKLVEEEKESVEKLLEQGLANKPRLNQLLRNAQDLDGRYGEISSSIASAREAIAQVELERINLRSEYDKEVNEMLREAQIRTQTLENEYNSAEDILERTTVRAPVGGIVTDLQYLSGGSVIAPGTILMTIVPQNDELIVEARLPPKDIQDVKIGLKAKVQLSAFKSRLVPRVTGEVIYISADKVTNQRDPASPFPEYYIIRVRISEEEIAKINADVILSPGMPADVFIIKGTRTFLQYIMGPFLDSFHRAFKEA